MTKTNTATAAAFSTLSTGEIYEFIRTITPHAKDNAVLARLIAEARQVLDTRP